MISWSPCVHSAVNALPDEVSVWDIVKYLLQIHPEYATEEIRNVLSTIDANYVGEKKLIQEWLVDVKNMYPREDLLHTGLVIVALLRIDPNLKKLFSSEAIASVESRITFK